MENGNALQAHGESKGMKDLTESSDGYPLAVHRQTVVGQNEAFKDIWDNLSQIDVSAFTKKKNNMTYLSWVHALRIVIEHYPSTAFWFSADEHHPDGSCTVHCTVCINGLQRSMFLPVMKGFKNTAVQNPNARDIGDNKMRCLVKCLALFGLGLHIYAGEDLPPDRAEGGDGSRAKAQTKAPSQEEALTTPDELAKLHAVALTLHAFVEGEQDMDALKAFWRTNRDALVELEKHAPELYKNVLDTFKAQSKAIGSK